MNNIFAKLVEESSELELVTKPCLALSVFRLVPPAAADEHSSLSPEALNDLNRMYFGRLSARHDIMLTQTVLNGIFCIRFAVGAIRTTERHIQGAFDILSKEAKISVENWEQSIKGTGTL